jgi:hypothetical protein
MKKSLIVQISEGFGNQLFMYANAFALSQDKKFNLLIDDTSGYSKKKNNLRGQKYLLNCLNIKQDIASNYLKPDTFIKHFIQKCNLFFDIFKNKKSYLFEDINYINGSKKISHLTNYDSANFHDNIFIRGNFENENYFRIYQNNLINLFSVKPEYIKNDLSLIRKLRNTNSISIHVRQNRFSDQNFIKNNNINILKSENFLNDNLDYIDRSINFFNSKIEKPTFFIWSNDFTNLDYFFSKYKEGNFYFIQGNDVLNDFNLFKYAKHFIVGPSTFHWWGAWLNSSVGKICVRPNNINPSNNDNFWPETWMKI